MKIVTVERSKVVARFYSEVDQIISSVDAVHAELRLARSDFWTSSYSGRMPQELFDEKPFSAILDSYEAILSEGLRLNIDDLYRDFYDEFAFRHSGRSSGFMDLGIAQVAVLLPIYYRLPEDQRESAKLRTDELMAMDPLADRWIYGAVWSNELPVEFLKGVSSRNRRFGRQDPYALVAFKNGHDPAASSIYGVPALRLLTADQLTEAVDLLRKIDPQAEPKMLSKLARFKATTVTPAAFLKALRLGYSTEEHLREAGSLIGVLPKSADFFAEVLGRGTDLSKAAEASLRDRSIP